MNRGTELICLKPDAMAQFLETLQLTPEHITVIKDVFLTFPIESGFVMYVWNGIAFCTGGTMV